MYILDNQDYLDFENQFTPKFSRDNEIPLPVESTRAELKKNDSSKIGEGVE